MPVEGGAELRAVALRLREAGEVGLKRAMNRNIRLATLPAASRVRASAIANLPRGGGLNQWVADAVIKTSITTGVRSAGVALRMRKTGHDMKSIDAGVVRHPTYGREPWRVTDVHPGFFTKPLEDMRPEVYAACQAAMREVTREAGFH